MLNSSISLVGLLIAALLILQSCGSQLKSARSLTLELPADLSRARTWFAEDTSKVKVVYLAQLPYSGPDSLIYTNVLRMKINILDRSAKEYCLLYGRSFERRFQDVKFERQCFPIR